MDDLLKLAQLFEKDTAPTSSVFKIVPYIDEAKNLALMAGKLHYRAQEENNPEKKQQLSHIAKLVLQAADMLKRV
jgi:hypothetical protein